MLRDNLVGLIVPMQSCGTQALGDEFSYLENPRPVLEDCQKACHHLHGTIKANTDQTPRTNSLLTEKSCKLVSPLIELTIGQQFSTDECRCLPRFESPSALSLEVNSR